MQMTRRRLEGELCRAARSPERFARAVSKELGRVSAAQAESLRARILRGDSWLPRLTFGSDADLYGREVGYSAQAHTVAVHEDLVHDEARIARLYREAVRTHALPAPRSWWGWLRPAAA